jgi:hypothetical protein
MKLLQLLGLRSLEDLPAPKAAVAAAPAPTEVPVQS